jgi:hypothetical protein
MESTTSLQHRLIDPSTASDDPNSSASRPRDGLLGTGGEPDSCLVIIWGVTNDGSIVAGSAGKSTTIADLLFNVANDGTFGAL